MVSDESLRRFSGIGSLYGPEALSRLMGAHVCVIGVGGVALGTAGIAPVGLAVITSYLAISTVKYFKTEQDTM